MKTNPKDGAVGMKFNGEGVLARRIMFAIFHPDCPILVLDHEASKLARHIAIRLNRQKGADE